jgi:hypothetical protein
MKFEVLGQCLVTARDYPMKTTKKTLGKVTSTSRIVALWKTDEPTPQIRNNFVMAGASDRVGKQQSGWIPPLFAMWSLCWRLSILLVFLLGTLGSLLCGRWGLALVSVVGFVLGAAVIRRVSTVERETSSEHSILFL